MTPRAEANANILVVDDEASIVRLFVRTLASAGYTNVHGITDATDVPAFLDSTTPDLVILDLNMPGMDGFALLREISQRLTEDTFLPVMAVSGMAGPEARERAFASGAKDFLAKPVDLQEFLLHVNSLLETRFSSLRLQTTQENLAELVGRRTEELQRSRALTQQVEEALHLSEQQFRLLTESSGAGVGFFSLEGTILFLNDVAAAQMGRESEELIGLSLAEVLSPAQLEEMTRRLEMVAETGQAFQEEERSTFAGGWSGWVLSTYTRVIDAAGEVRGVQVVSMDITERKLAEQDLAESEERFNKAFHSNPALSTIAAPDGRIIDANDAWLRAIGYTREEVIGHTTEELGVVRQDDRSMLVRSALGESPIVVEIHVRTKSGEPLTVLASAEQIDIKGQRCLLATAMDITERKAMEDSLRLTKFCIDNAAEAILWYDQEGRVQYANEHCSVLFGYGAGEFLASTLFALDPDVTLEGWAQQWERMKRDGPLTFSVKPQKKNGDRFYGEVTAAYLRHGDLEQCITFLRDVTDSHLAAEALRASENRLSQMFESMSSGVLVLEVVGEGDDFLIREMNRAAEQITRVLRTDGVGFSMAEIFPGIRPMGLFEVLVRVSRTGEPEALAARPYEDEHLSFWVENYVYRLPSGEIVVMFDDVSEKHQALADLQQAYTRLRTTQAGTLEALGAVVEFRDPYTAGHQQRVGKIAVLIGKKLGMSPHRLEGLLHAATVHDVGKIAVPIEILSSPGILSELQHTLVRQHVESGFEILKPIAFDWPIAEIVRQHHERLDGSGYPRGLKGEEIMLEARILSVADTAEAMISHRPYRPARGTDAAKEELLGNSGILYDAAAVEALMSLDLDAIAEENEAAARHVRFWGGPEGRSSSSSNV